jgi:NAD(P)-dependent dehydrogenase (short-subunit alcohol dehydrogenase family)
MSFSNKVFVVTGGASGIGFATAEYLASRGAKVSLCDQNQKLLDEAIAEIESSGGQAIGTALDVRSRVEVEAWIRKTVEEFGKLDGAVNAAGVSGKGVSVEWVHEVSDADWDFVFDVNVKGVLNALRAEIINMTDGGSIVNISSLLGVTGTTRMATYAASKHAVVGLSRVAAKELGARNIRVNVVCP